MKTKPWFRLLSAFALPILLYTIILAAARVVPFGNNTLLFWDANTQYADFYQYLRRVLQGDQDGLYSFGFAFGGNSVGLIAYYLASPLNLLFAFAGPQQLPLMYNVLVLLKIGLCGFTFYLFVRSVYRCGWMGLFFSTSYALMAYVAAYAWIPMWLDALIWLPLVALGLRRIASGKRPFLYIHTLSITVFSQFYIGYMVCLFTLIYFLFLLLEKPMPWRQRLRACLRYILGSALAIGLAAALLLPAFHAMSGSYTLFDLSRLQFTQRHGLFDIFTKFYTATISIPQMVGGMGNLSIGTPMTVLFILFLFNPAIRLRARLFLLGLCAFLIVSFQIDALYFLWHAFEYPSCFPARFSFLLSFLMIEMAYQGYHALEETAFPRLSVVSASVAGGFAMLTAVLFHSLEMEYIAFKTLVMDFVFFIAACGLVIWLSQKRRRRLCLMLLCAMQSLCLLASGYYAYRRISLVNMVSESEYAASQAEYQSIVDQIQTADDGVYRMELNDLRTDNQPLSLGYRGLSHFSSIVQEDFLDFTKAIGAHHDYYDIAFRSGTTPVLASLFGLKYIALKQDASYGEVPGEYTPLWSISDVTVYENPTALPLAYLVPPQRYTLDDSNPFVNQSMLLKDLAGVETDVFTPLPDLQRTYDGTWETYSFTAQAGRQLYMKSASYSYRINGGEELPGKLLNGSILLPVPAKDMAYSTGITAPLKMQLAYFDPAVFQSAMDVLSSYTAAVSSETDSRLAIQVNVPEGRQQLMVTIPYDPGWHAWVDGVEAETVSRYGALLAINLPPGAHEVELRFIPEGLDTGLLISGVSLLLLAGWALLPIMNLRFRRKRRDGAKGEIA